MRRKKSDDDGGPNWLDTYADMVTLLLTFFILLFSISTVNAEKWEIIVKSFAGAAAKSDDQIVVNANVDSEIGDGLVANYNDGTGTDVTAPPETPEEIEDFDDLYLYLKSYIEKNQLESDVALNKGDTYAFITFRNNIFFDGDSAVIKKDGKDILNALSAAFTNISDQIAAVKFDGHSARAGVEYNRADAEFDFKLSTERATNVLLYVANNSTIDPAKLTPAGHGEYMPVVPHDGTEESRIKNRRVEIYIAKAGSEILTLDSIYDEIYKGTSGEQNN